MKFQFATNPISQKGILAVGFFVLLITCAAVYGQGFESVTSLTPIDAVKNTGDKPQSKVWTHDGKWWTVMPASDGTFIWLLNGTVWNRALKISDAKTVRADCKPNGNVCHVLLWRKEDYPSQLISVEYVPAYGTYKLWALRPATVYINLDAGVEIATIDIDGNGRMWLASDAITSVNIRWSDQPYTLWSSPITIATNISTDDICVVKSIPALNKVGILWSNQISKRFGFKTHNNNDDPSVWSADEVPASQSALNIKTGMADDHLNVGTVSDGTLYCAVKTGYDTPGYPEIALLKRHPSGTWDNLYEVSQVGTRPIVLLNESTEKVKVIYTSNERGGNILYKESPISTISFGPTQTLITGALDNATSIKDNYTSQIVILAADTFSIPKVYGVLAKDPSPVILPSVPVLSSPADLATEVALNTTLSWNISTSATEYQAQVSTVADFTTTIIDQDHITATSVQAYGLSPVMHYYWRVRAESAAGNSAWSNTWSFYTLSQVPGVPVLVSPANESVDVKTNVDLIWNPVAQSDSYSIQVSTSSSFTTPFINAGGITSASYPVTGLANNTPYYWRVRAVNAVGPGEWSPIYKFTTVEAISNALVGFWKMNEGSGQALFDETNFQNAAALNGSPVWVTGVNGLALRLNGVNQYALVPDAMSLDVSQGITIAAWIMPEKKASQYIIQKGETVDGYEFGLLSTGKVSFRFNQITLPNDKVNSKAIYPINGTWMHVAATFDGTQAKIYINGILDKTQTFSPPTVIKTNDSPLTIGSKNDGGSSLKGSLDDVRIFNYALSASEIFDLTSQSSSARLAWKGTISLTEEGDHASENISVYPNPVGDIFFLLPTSKVSKETTFLISDIYGKTNFPTTIENIEDQIAIDLRDLNLNSGLYLLHVRAGNYHQVVKFVKK
jgi:hypothetical protein